ncbi:hypothetical protein K1Y78_53740 [Streptomyces sp. tea 10]|nr:hypothetical protein [Streptomyces sp. tea 10]
MNSIDPGQAIDVASKVLAAIVSLVGIVVAIGQWTRPAVLKHRVKWLHEAIEQERNEARLATLRSMLDNANASLVAGVLVPGWRFLPLAAVMLLGPLQAFVWARKDAGLWNIVGALGFSLVISMNPIRRGVRLLAERYRVAHEYHGGSERVQTARLGSLNQMEGGTRAEMGFGLVAALGLNAVAVGIALAYLAQIGWGLAVGLVGAVLTVVIAGIINGYARKRVGIYGPWSVDDPRM